MLYLQDFTILHCSFLVKMVCPKFFWKPGAGMAQREAVFVMSPFPSLSSSWDLSLKLPPLFHHSAFLAPTLGKGCTKQHVTPAF